jgi:hypothetical protein
MAPEAPLVGRNVGRKREKLNGDEGDESEEVK